MSSFLSNRSLATQQSSCTGCPYSSNLHVSSCKGLLQMQQYGVALSRGVITASPAGNFTSPCHILHLLRRGFHYFGHVLPCIQLAFASSPDQSLVSRSDPVKKRLFELLDRLRAWWWTGRSRPATMRFPHQPFEWSSSGLYRLRSTDGERRTSQARSDANERDG